MATAHALVFTVCLLVSVSAVSGLGTAEHPPRHTDGEKDDPLDPNETATLWSNTPNECLDAAEYEERYAAEPTQIQQLATCTDITFKSPPPTATTWTNATFHSLQPGGSNTSVYPEHAKRTDSGVIRDAHATIFAIQPSTIAHLDPDESPQYVASNGTVRGLVDYGVQEPTPELSENGSTQWRLLDHSVAEVRLLADGAVLATKTGTQTPELAYSLDDRGPTTLTLEAELSVQTEEILTDDASNESAVSSQQSIETVTVSQSIDVVVYDPVVYRHHVTYPDGDRGIALYQTQPWHGYTLGAEQTDSVRGVWRYYTARDTEWDYLVTSTSDETDRAHSPALPVYVHAYPSTIGPRVEPVRDGPELLDVWGTESETPESAIPEYVDVDVIDEQYTRSYGLAIRTDPGDDELAVQGIIHGVNGSVVEPDDGSTRHLRSSSLSVSVTEQTEHNATLRIELTDGETGAPIVLNEVIHEQPRWDSLGAEPRAGYLTLNGDRLPTNASGVAFVSVSEPGSYTVQYHPGSWRTHDPAYVGETTTVTWHPLTSFAGWLSLTSEFLWILAPFIVAAYAGRKLSTFLRIEDYP